MGFSKCEVIGAPTNSQKGFQRPIKLFTKGETPPSQTPRGDDSSQVVLSQAVSVKNSVADKNDVQNEMTGICEIVPHTNPAMETDSSCSESIQTLPIVEDSQIELKLPKTGSKSK